MTEREIMPEGRPPDARERAQRFFALLTERGELRRSLRVGLSVEAGLEQLAKGQAHDLLELLRERLTKPKEARSKAETKETPEKTQARERLGSLDAQIKSLLAEPGVHEAIHEARRGRVRAGAAVRQVMNEWSDLRAVLEELNTQDFALLRRRSITSADRQLIEDNARLRAASEARLNALVEQPETARPARLAELFEYRQQLLEHKFAMTPSRRALAGEVRKLWARGNAVLLSGSTGTGKTELFSYLTRTLYGRPLSRLIRATERVGPPEIFGKMTLRATPEGGTETRFQPGVYTWAADEGMPFIIDEFNLLDPKIRFGLKELYNRGPGDEVMVQEDSGQPHRIKEGFVFGATSNIKSAKYKERFELDPAESRIFAARRVDFLPKEEVYDVLLSALMNDQGELRLAREDAAETLKRLLEAAELSQEAFEGRQTQFYAEGGGAKKKHAVLEKAVLDPGKVLKILSAWPVEEARGVRFRDFLEDELLHFIRTEDYPEADRRLLLQVFITKGFFCGRGVKEMGVPGVDEAKLKAWGWTDVLVPPPATEVLPPEQIAVLDPFGLRQIRAAEAADEFLRKGQEDAARALGALRGIELSRLPKAVRELLEKKASPADTILAQGPDGREVRFDLKEIRQTWDVFYRSHNLSELADALPSTIRLTQEQLDIIKEKAKEGYTRVLLIPSGIDQHLAKLKENLTDGLGQDAKGNPIKTLLSDNVKPSFPNQIKTVSLSDPTKADPSRAHAYLLLTNPDQPLLPGSQNKTADELIPELQAAGLQGLTLADFLIEERLHFEATSQHLIDWGRNDWTWLLGSRDAASRVLGAGWYPDYRLVGVGSYPSDDRDLDLGVRPSVVLGLVP